MNDDEKASTNLAGVADNKHKFTGQTCQAVLRMAYCISHISLLISSSPPYCSATASFTLPGL